ncbi:hypothetical protein FOPG_11490 [Fusarium oxysporum f. sp. conglutinans race 2 54008]|uniref:Uncharacterized protein n=1 Tax=Fusarium oxysporum f. sp. conglutinans race 2 54008 TaxID=1089457 RepID=X0HMT7_FUSOX|nr:hypothetical protein FOPG_11490 [Fusarium oxysporum f. sp. conglutinans race 2 54008]
MTNAAVTSSRCGTGWIIVYLEFSICANAKFALSCASASRDDQDEGSSQGLQSTRKKNIKTKGQTDTKTEVQARQIIHEDLKTLQDAEEQRNAFEKQLEEKEAQRKAIMRDLSLIQSQRESQYNLLKLDSSAESPSLRCGTVEDLQKLDVEQEQHAAELHRLRIEISTIEAKIVSVKKKVKDIVSGIWSKMRTHLGKHGDWPWGVLERLKKDRANDDMELVVRLINMACLEKYRSLELVAGAEGK